MKITRNITIFCILGFMGIALSGMALRRNNRQDMSPDAILEALQQKLLDATHNVSGFDETIPEIIKEGAEKLKGDKERFEKLIFTIGDDGLTIIAHLVTEYDPNELIDTIHIIREFFGKEYIEVARLMRRRDGWGRSPLYYTVLRKRDTMLETLLSLAVQIFGHDKKQFLLFINGENDEGQREIANYRTPFILVAYNDDGVAARLLMQVALEVFGKNTSQFNEFIQARDADGAVAGFYAGDKVLAEAARLCIRLR